MPDLVELQSRMAQGLLHGRFEALLDEIAPGPIPAAEALGLHRNTALQGLANALRLTYPTVLALVGEDFFDQAALAFALGSPPDGACLQGYGGGFADFLVGYDLAQGLPYLADVARLDLAIEVASGFCPGVNGVALDLGEAVLVLDASLGVLRLDYPAPAIRDAIEEDEDQLARIDISPQPRAYALWRGATGAAVRPLSPLSAAFLEALLKGEDPAPVLEGADDPSVLQSEVFTAPFARLRPSTSRPIPCSPSPSLSAPPSGR